MFDFSKVSRPKGVTKESVLQKIDVISAYSYYFGEQISLNKKYKNPLRKDNDAGCVFSFKNNNLLFIDYSRAMSYDLFLFVQHKYNLNFDQALNKVIDDMGVTVQNTAIVQQQMSKEFNKKLIQVSVRPYTSLDLQYWGQYQINQDDLKNENIYSIDKLWIDKKPCKLHELAFAYHYPDVDGFKIYQPLNTVYKWFNNIPFTYIDGLKDLPFKSDSVLLASSKKDKMVIKKVFTDVCSVQGENPFAISTADDEFLNSHYKHKFCFFDSDLPGKEANKKLNSKGYGWINIPNEYYEHYGIKDPSDFIKKFKSFKYIQNLILKKCH